MCEEERRASREEEEEEKVVKVIGSAVRPSGKSAWLATCQAAAGKLKSSREGHSPHPTQQPGSFFRGANSLWGYHGSSLNA